MVSGCKVKNETMLLEWHIAPHVHVCLYYNFEKPGRLLKLSCGLLGLCWCMPCASHESSTIQLNLAGVCGLPVELLVVIEWTNRGVDNY